MFIGFEDVNRTWGFCTELWLEYSLIFAGLIKGVKEEGAYLNCKLFIKLGLLISLLRLCALLVFTE